MTDGSIREASTPDEMRAEIYRLAWHDPLVRRCMDSADYKGLSGEDRYVLLAYAALRSNAALTNDILQNARTNVTPGFVLRDQ